MTTNAASVGLEPLDLRMPFTSAEAAQAKISRRRLMSAEFVRMFQGIYISRNVTRTVRMRAIAALRLAPPAAIISHHTAALLWGGAIPASSKIHLIPPAKLNCQKVGIQPHRFRSPPKAVLHQQIRVTSPERTFCDLGSYLDLVELVVLGDRFVRRSVTTPERLRFEANNWAGDYATVLRRAAMLVREGVDSPPESRLRMLVVLAGLPEPTVNFTIRDPTTGRSSVDSSSLTRPSDSRSSTKGATIAMTRTSGPPTSTVRKRFASDVNGESCRSSATG